MAQVSTDFENFESFATGATPSQAWYSWNGACGSVGPGSISGQALVYTCTGNSPFGELTFTNPGPTSVIYFEVGHVTPGASISSRFLCFKFYSSVGQIGEYQLSPFTGPVRWRGQIEGASLLATNEEFLATGSGPYTLHASTAVYFDFTAKTLTDNGVTVNMLAGAHANLLKIRFDKNQCGSGVSNIASANFDNLIYDGTQAFAPETPEIEDFGGGMTQFISGLGFVTPASQFFFSLILVGIATVSGGVGLKFMAPGRMKLIIILSIAGLVGAFCAILQLFDLWIFVLSAVLGATVVKGAGEVRNTWREIRETAANRSRTLNQDGEVVQETMQTAQEQTMTAKVESAD